MAKEHASKIIIPSSSGSEHQRQSLKERDTSASFFSSTQSKTKSKLPLQTFNFSDESDDDGEKEILSPTVKPNLLKQNTSQLFNVHKELYAKAGYEHAEKENLEPSKSFSTKDGSAVYDSQWQELLKTPRCQKSQMSSSTCKKLLSSKNVTAYFHSTPKESKGHTKQKDLFLQRRCMQSQNLKSKADINLLSSVPLNDIKDDHNFYMINNETSQDDYVEVQDSSAQTSFQSCDKSGLCKKNVFQEISHFSSNSSKGYNIPKTSQDNVQLSQSLSDDKDMSPHSCESFVEVQDISVQVNLTDQDSSNIFSDWAMNEVSKIRNQENSTANKNSSVSLQGSLEQNILHGSQSREDDSNNSAASNSLYISAIEPETIVKDKETSSPCLASDREAATGSQCSQSLWTMDDQPASAGRCEQASAYGDREARILVANTDSDCSETDVACGFDFVEIEASYSEGSGSAEDDDELRKEANDNRCPSENQLDPCLDTAVNFIEKQSKDQKGSIIDREDTFMTQASEKADSFESCIPVSHGIDNKTVNKGRSSVSDISDMLKSTTISSSCRKICDSSDEEDAFEKFLAKMKAPAPTVEKAALEKSMNDFIAADDEDLSEKDSSCSNSSEDEMFHVRVDNIIDSKTRKGRTNDMFLLDEKTSHETDRATKSSPSLDISSDDDDLLDDFIKDAELRLKSTTTSFDTSDSFLPEPKSVSKLRDLTSSLCSTMPRTPQSKFRVQTSGDDDNDDDFKTPFQTPRRPVKPLNTWERPFETPAGSFPRKSGTLSAVQLQDKRSCPMTVSRLHRPSRPSNIGLDDDAIFLKSLAEDYPDFKRHPEALRYIKYFKDKKADLTKRLFSIYNKSIFKDQLPADLEIEWSALYRKTAGTFCYRSSPAVEAKITLSVKVCDRAERVRDTLAHELCHAAVRLINGVKESHGPVWRSWAQRINRAFPFMPVIARCHDYIIVTKYTYKCTKCNYRIGRHSKSLDIDKKVCGHCLGRFEVFLTRDLNNSEGGQTPATPRTPRTPNKFALFVKESYANVKSKDSNLKHADVMKILSQQFSEKTKISE